MKDNSLAVLVAGFLVLIVIILILMPKSSTTEILNPPSAPLQEQTEPKAIPERHVPHGRPEVSGQRLFWDGYRDGYRGYARLSSHPEYNRGFDIGLKDRRIGRRDYYDNHCPPNFRFNIRF